MKKLYTAFLFVLLAALLGVGIYSPPASTAFSPPFRPRRTGNFMRSILRRSSPAALRG